MRWKNCAALAVGLGLGLLLGCRKSTPSPPPLKLAAVVATCASENGEVTERRPGAPYWEPVRVGSVFRLADWVRTGELSTARVEFLSGGAVELEPNTIVVIDRPPSRKPGEAASTRVALQQGAVRGFLPEQTGSAGAPAGPLRLRTVDGRELSLTPVRGTGAEFRLEQRNGKTEVTVLAGAARIATVGGERSLVAGQYARIEAGGLPGAPEQLIAFPSSVAPGVDARFRGTPALSITLRWGEVGGASGYRLQVARDLSFQKLVVNEDLAGTAQAFRPGEMGMFAWRVASRDQEGRIGEYGFARRIFVESDPPKDRLIEPAAGAVLRIGRRGRIPFRWEAAAKDSRYQFVLAKTKNLLASQVLSKRVVAPRVELGGVAPGKYRWGVYVVEPGGELEPIFLAPRTLTVKRAKRVRVISPATIRHWGE